MDDMAKCATNDLCDICEASHRTSPAVKWCPECEEMFCDDCIIHHSVSKLSRQHTVIDIKHYRKLPDSSLVVKTFCDEHEMKYTNLCTKHDKLCCPACISSTGQHSNCNKFLLLKDIVTTAKTSTLLQSVEASLNNLKINLQLIINDRKTNLNDLHDQETKIKKEVTKFREQITGHLIYLEKQVLEELKVKVQQNTTQLESEIANLQQKLEKVQKEIQETNSIKQYGSDLQTYVGSKSMEADVARETKSLEDMIRDGSLKRLELNLKYNKKTDDIIPIISSFGSISENAIPLSIVLTSAEGKQVQINATRPKISIDDITVTLKLKLKLSDITINVRGCFLSSSNEMLFANSTSNNIIVVNENGEKETEKVTSSGPWDITGIDDNTIAVSTNEGVKIINIITYTVERSINNRACRGLEYYKGSLICCVVGKGVRSVDLSSSTITTLVPDTFNHGYNYCTVHNDRIYVSRSYYYTITCYTMTGDKVWQFKDTSVINNPLGITVDNSSNVYVASNSNHRIVVLSPDGQRCRTLLTEKDGINRPCALYCDKRKNQLLVGNDHGPAFLFEL